MDNEESYIVTTIDWAGAKEVRKITQCKEDAIQYYKTVEAKHGPELWKKWSIKDANNSHG